MTRSRQPETTWRPMKARVIVRVAASVLFALIAARRASACGLTDGGDHSRSLRRSFWRQCSRATPRGSGIFSQTPSLFGGHGTGNATNDGDAPSHAEACSGLAGVGFAVSPLRHRARRLVCQSRDSPSSSAASPGERARLAAHSTAGAGRRHFAAATTRNRGGTSAATRRDCIDRQSRDLGDGARRDCFDHRSLRARHHG